MPQAEPYRAWATFSFAAASGRVNECDLFILVPRGLFLVELKAHPGRLVNTGSVWNFHGSDRRRTIENPLSLTDLKSKELKTRLLWAANKFHPDVKIPRISPAVFLSAPGLQSELDEVQRTCVYGRNDGASGLPRIWDDFLNLPPAQSNEKQRREFFRLAQVLPDLMARIGVRGSGKHLDFGDGWRLESRPLAGGPTWEDRLAKREHPVREEGRLRIYLLGQQPDEAHRRSVERAARREYQVLQGINHRGIAQALQIGEHLGGPAILFRHRAADLRLDAYLATHGVALTPEIRLDLVRQLADALRYAHSRSLYHRALAARSVYVACRRDGSEPVLRIVDWQVAARDFDTTSMGSIGDPSVNGEHVEDSAQVFLAPEFEQPYADPADLDLFGLGALTHLVLTGHPPADRRSNLLEHVRAEGGLRMRAVSDEVPEALDALVYDTTRAEVSERLESVDRFVAELDRIEQELVAPELTVAGTDPLAAVPGQTVDGEWTVERVLGSGATAKALLVSRDTEDEDGRPRTERQVLKVALDERRADRLRAEARALREVGGGFVIRLWDGPRGLHERTVLDLEYAGERSLGAKLRAEGRLTYHELQRFSQDLFTALDQLAAKGERHRDLKPDNFGVLRRADGSWQLMLFDFSLAGVSDRDITAGTPGYLDPFLGADPRRPVFDDQAELYAAAVTLHEMASGDRPHWGDGMSHPAVTEIETPTLTTEGFESALRDGLTAFFERALHRDASRRFESLRHMRDNWQSVFTVADATAPASTPATVNGVDQTVQEARDRAAAHAELDTPLGAAGLSPAAESAANALGATRVDELLAIPPHLISRARGTGALVRRELNRRHRQWKTHLQRPNTSPTPTDDNGPAGAAEPSLTLTDDSSTWLSHTHLNVLDYARRLAPAPGRKGSHRADVVRLTLGLPNENGLFPPLPGWCSQSEIAAHLGIQQPSVSRHHKAAIQEWIDDPALTALRHEIAAYVRAAGGVVTAQEIAAELQIRKGVGESDPRLAQALSLAVVRAAVEAETWPYDRTEEDQPRLAVLRRGSRVLVAAESLPGTEDPAPRDLAHYAAALGGVADDVASTDPLPGAVTVVRALRAVPVPPGMAPLADTRLVALAAAVAQDAQTSPRLELYPRGLGLARALRISQAAAGAHRERGLTVEELLARVRSRFPDLQLGAPTRVEMEEALDEAGFTLTFDPETQRFRPPAPEPVGSQVSGSSTGISHHRGHGVAVAAAAAGRNPLELLQAKLEDSRRRGGFLALTFRGRYLPGVADGLTATQGVLPIDVGRLFLREFRALANERGTWNTVLTHDVHFTASGELSTGLRSYVRGAWERVGERMHEQIREAPTRTVFLLHNAGLLGRYNDAGGHDLLVRLQNAARRADRAPHGLWMLCPGESQQATPQLDGRIVEVLVDVERAVLTRDFLATLAPGDSQVA